jgi:transposase
MSQFPRPEMQEIGKSADQPLTLTERLIHEKVREQRDVLARLVEEIHAELQAWKRDGKSEVDTLIAIWATVDDVRWPLP